MLKHQAKITEHVLFIGVITAMEPGWLTLSLGLQLSEGSLKAGDRIPHERPGHRMTDCKLKGHLC